MEEGVGLQRGTRNFWETWNVLCLNWDSGYTVAKIHQTAHLKRMPFTVF